MAAHFENFDLQDLVAKGEDAFRLSSLAMAEGQRLRGYRGDYFRLLVGDAVVSVRCMPDPKTGDEELLGFDTHAVTDTRWQCRVVKDLSPKDRDPMTRRILVEPIDGGEATAVIDLVTAQVLPDWEPGQVLELGMVGLPLRVDYAESGTGEVMEAQEDTVLLQGTVKDARVGETYLGMEPLTKFLMVKVSTPFGDLTLCHSMDLVKDGQKDLVRTGAVVSAYCVLSGDAAVGRYAGGVAFDEDTDLALLRSFFLHGDAQRLAPALNTDCAVQFLENRQQGAQSAQTLLDLVGQQLQEAGITRCDYGRITAVEGGEGRLRTGQRCLLLGNEKGYGFICGIVPDSVGRIREVVITNDGRYDCEKDQ